MCTVSSAAAAIYNLLMKAHFKGGREVKPGEFVPEFDAKPTSKLETMRKMTQMRDIMTAMSKKDK